MDCIAKEIQTLKKEKDIAVLAHYYVRDEVQKVADYTGDSYYLSKIATTLPHKTILFCGVKFMGESAKILNPEKKVLMANDAADCPMAHMVDLEEIATIRTQFKDVAVVCYINSTAEVKAHSDVCVTSSNAVQIVKNLPQKTIYFIPDENLGRHVAAQVPEKHFIFGSGYCHVHVDISRKSIDEAKAQSPSAKVLAHPECKTEILELADFIGSTSGILNYATVSPAREFIIGTETGTRYELERMNPNKTFLFTDRPPVCPDMKSVTLDSLLEAMKNQESPVEIEPELQTKAHQALNRMLELAK